MRAVTIKEARAHLNEIIEAAQRGEQVVLMRGAKHVAAIVPITADDLELAPRLADEQAERLWRALAEERAAGRAQVLPTAEAAVARLAALAGDRQRSQGQARAERRVRPARS
ncbi:MAG: type II toxin-antitoxin system prevent-host-death family antitoxin [Deltaproteobacteria bacterium]|nr:type II toxin-antitoxin system prevent-host-death family antitoxin [Deltaproteobacteria bacterium]